MSETRVQTAYLVNPGDANPLEILHGGIMMNWIVSTGTLAVSRLSRGNAVLGSLDSVFFVNPVKVGDLVRVDSWVEYVGTSSAEVAVRAQSENPVTHKLTTTTFSHLAFVAVDFRGEPRPINVKLTPTASEMESYRLARQRWQNRRRVLADRRAKSLDVRPYATTGEWRLNSSRIVFSDDALYGELMFAGRLLKLLDELTGNLATKFCGGSVVTGSVDEMSFYHPIRVGDILDVSVALNYVGKSSLELGAKVVTEDPFSGKRRHAATAYYTFVHLDKSGHPASVPEYRPSGAEALLRFKEAQQRMGRRKRKLTLFKKYISTLSVPAFI
ncbi:MAG: acyl-CoA thioesterase [Thermoprotei archaeon]